MDKINLENLTGDQILQILKFIDSLKDDIFKVNYIHLPFKKEVGGKNLLISLLIEEL